MLTTAAIFTLVLTTVLAAPLNKVPEAPPSSAAREVQQQEEELQSLLKIADEKSEHHDVTVHEESVQRVHEVNGHKTEVDTARKTVSDTATGRLLSDVKQEVVKPDKSANAKQPEVEVKTEVDVPAVGIHETIIQSGPQAVMEPESQLETVAESQGDLLDGSEFSAEGVAQYLYRTGDMDRFYRALAQLVNASLMTEEEAETYSQLVALEYDKLQMEEFEEKILLQRRAPEPYARYPAALAAKGYPYPYMIEPQDEFDVGEREEVNDLHPNPLTDRDFDPAALIYALANGYISSGDPRALALAADLLENFQNDPDDESHRALDVLNPLMTNHLQPQYDWQPLMDAEVMRAEVKGKPVPAQAVPANEDVLAANQLKSWDEKRAAEQPTFIADTKIQKAAHPIETNPSQAQKPMADGEERSMAAKAGEDNKPGKAANAVTSLDKSFA